MAVNNATDISEDRTLKYIYDEGMELFEKIENDKEPTNSPAVQMSIKSAMQKFEEATKLVSLSGVFSTNESIDEVSTESLQYLLLPALLATLSLKLCNKPRREVIDLAEIYFRDFLQRCKDYGVTNIEVPAHSSNENDDSVALRNQNEQSKITSMVLTREAKIKRYREMKELQAQLATLKKAMASENADEQSKREYFVKLLLNYVNQSLDELHSIEEEKPILEYMAKHAGENLLDNRKKPTQPLKPIIITKDAVQKAIYGLGYPSLPTMTVEEFYDKRVKEGIFPGSTSTNIPHQTIQNAEATSEDNEKMEKERLVEEEDPDELRRQRNMDEYKDDHRRGSGNRYNRS